MSPCSPPGHPHHRVLTDFPDSPSVYSHAYQSPDADVLTDSPSFSRSDQHFDDETASTIHTFSTDDIQGDSDLDDFTDDASHRISLRGPRIRFHSPAPWETDDVFPHPGLPDNNSRSVTVGSRLRGKASKADTLIRTFTRRPSVTSRPSIDSARSQVSATSSFEITAGNYSSSRGALYDLAKESMSTSSLSSSASVRQQDFVRTNNSSKPSQYFSRARAPRTTVSLDGIAPSSRILESTPPPPSSFHTSRTSQERSTSPSTVRSSQEQQPRNEFVHPYANPDLVVPYTSSPETIPSHHLILGDMSGSDSNSTIADSTSVRSAAFSIASTGTSTTSFTSRDLPSGHLRVNGKEISSPVSVLHQSDSSYVDRNTRFLSLHPPPGFDGPRSPTVTLITLQEAQARERVRNSTVHTTVARPKLPFPNADDGSETTEDQPEDMDINGIPHGRSTSGGARHMIIPTSPTQSQEIGEESTSSSMNTVSGRALKHKKSGFMRLFTGRSSEGEKERNSTLPIPALTDAYAKQTPGAGKASKSVPRVQNSCSSTLSAPGASCAPPTLTTNALSGGDGSNEKGPSRRRQPPSLSIVTKTPDHGSSATARNSSTGLTFTPPPPFSHTVPQSAPPGGTDFLGLKLRPVSSTFSSHFADMVTTAGEVPRRDVDTPSSATSSSTALSPFTPLSTRRSDDALAIGVETQSEEYLTVKGLQDQFAFAKREIWELLGRIRDLTSELEDLRVMDQKYCGVCGRGKPQTGHALPSDEQQLKKVTVLNRPRARTGDTARFASGNN